ncbi:alpha/beta hydrolase [Streptomyces sp. CRN 30]|uniref:alpha/beta fold hydrolase n=1 Tax=Streptomyces sp. CRN 30 TaxID=3075613 RepID=UPI002A806095|nr:alpha/beta hydrolase [Streptomyces sp. CRN 30]
MAVKEKIVTLSWHGMSYDCRYVAADRRPTTEPLVVVSGGVQHVHAWARLEKRITSHTDIIIPELPDLDDAPDPADQCFDSYIGVLCHALDQLRVERVNFLGVSYGAPIAFRLARAFPERIARLLLVGATHEVHAGVAELTRNLVDRPQRTGDHAMEEAVDEQLARSIVKILVNSSRAEDIPHVSAVNRMLQRYFTHHAGSSRRYVTSHRLLLDEELYPPGGLHGIPTLVFTGEHDQTSTPDENRAVAATITDSTFTLIKNADHMVHLEREAEYADLVLRFIQDRSLEGLDYCTPLERLKPSAARRTAHA